MKDFGFSLLGREMGKIKIKSHLEGHEVSLSNRGNLLDWILNVFTILEISSKCFFVAADLFDLYLLYSLMEGEAI